MAAEPDSGIKLGMAYQYYVIDYLGDSPVAKAYPLGWHRVLFLPSGRLSPQLSFKSRFAIDSFGVSAAGLGAGHIRSSGLDIGSPFYVDWAYASFTPGPDTAWHFGTMNLDRELPIGSGLKNPFDTSAVYSITFTRYGGVGTPPLKAGGTLDAASTRPANWLMGTNVALETLDPASTFANFPAPGLSLIYKQKLGSARVSLATNNGVFGASPARAHDPALAKTLTLPANFPESPAQHNGYSLAILENDFGFARLQAGLRADNNTLGTERGKYSSLTLDVGDSAVGGSLSLAGAGLPTDRLGASVFSGLPGGFGVGLGLKANGIGFLQPSSYPFTSYGPMLKTPGIGFLPPFVLSAQQTRGAADEALAAGYTVETSFKPHPALPAFNLEYSGGKFDPAGGNGWFTGQVTHHVVSFLTTFAF